MKQNKKLFLALFFVVTALLSSACSVQSYTSDFGEGRIVAGESYTLPNNRDGNELHDSLVVFGGDVSLLEDSIIYGDVVVFGGSIDVAGEITNDMVIFGGEVNLSDEAVIGHDLVAIGSSFNRSPGAVVGGQVITEVPGGEIPRINFNPQIRTISSPFNSFNYVLRFFFNTFAFTALSVLMMLFLPKQIQNTAKIVESRPIASGGLGCLTVMVVPIIATIILFTIILSPISILAYFLLGLGICFGWITVGLVVGRRLGEALNQEWTPVVEAAIGTFGVTLVAGALGFVPPLAFLVVVSIGAVGLGAVVISRFGTQSPLVEEIVEVEVEEPKPKAKTKSKTKAAKSKTTKKKA